MTVTWDKNIDDIDSATNPFTICPAGIEAQPIELCTTFEVQKPDSAVGSSSNLLYDLGKVLLPCILAYLAEEYLKKICLQCSIGKKH